MAAETQYVANTGCVTISTANTNLDGTGTLGTVLTSPSSGYNGTIVKSVTIKAQTNTTQGMIRLFVVGGGSTELVSEIEVPAITKSGTVASFGLFIITNFALKPGYILKASTQNAETFNVVAEGLDWKYYTTSVRPESTKYTANTGMTAVSTANTNLDGTGTLGTVLTPDATANGCQISSVNLKATVNTTAGMIRLYVYDGTTNYLIREIPVPAITKSGTATSYSYQETFMDQGFALKATYLLKASTQNAESMNVVAQGLDWTYPA